MEIFSDPVFVLAVLCLNIIISQWLIKNTFLKPVTVLVLMHGIVIYGIGALLRWDWVLISVVSQANIGGSSTALALARSLGRPDLMLPAILVGSLGNGLGAYLEFLVTGFF